MSLQSRLSDVIGNIGTDVKSINSNISIVSNNLSNTSSRLNLVSNNLSNTSSRLTLVSNSISNVSSRLNTVSGNLSGVSSTLNAVSSNLAGSGGSSDYAQISTYRKLFEFEDLEGWTLSTAGTGAEITNIDTAISSSNHMGVIRLDTGTTATGTAVMEYKGLRFRPANTLFEALISSIDNNSDYSFKIGFFNITGTGGTESAGFGLEINKSISNYIQALCYNSSYVLTRTNTTQLFDTANYTYYLVKAVMNSGGTQCDFYINIGSGYSLVASITGSIYPDSCVPAIKLFKLSGTTNRKVLVDIFYVQKTRDIFHYI